MQLHLICAQLCVTGVAEVQAVCWGLRWDRREASRREAVSWVKMRGPG